MDNRSAHPLHLHGCGAPVSVALSGRHYHPHPAGPACSGTVTVPAGQTTYPVKIDTTYLSCSVGHPDGDTPQCDPGDRRPPLPPGTYQASLSAMASFVPPPSPITIHVTRS